uniref:Uncharacterized protein n=1 Tax=Aegilops tauschii subsp. strangulata TaxID=200361 RepID=A0A453GVL6_AEGTS
MEGKAILLCLMVLVQLGNSVHVDKCRAVIAFSGTTCIELSCMLACQKSFGDHAINSACRLLGLATLNCYCKVCD